MKVADVVGYAGHQIHIARRREARALFEWLGDLTGRGLLDVGGGDGYWAGQARRLGAIAYSIDVDARRLDRGLSYSRRPFLVRGDALRLPFPDGAFDAVMSISSLEHFPSGADAISEMARVLRPGGSLVLSADSVGGRDRWPHLATAHDRRYGVVERVERQGLEQILVDHGLKVLRVEHMFKKEWTKRLYLGISRYRVAWNIAAPLAPVVALSDRRDGSDSGSIVLVHARRYS